MLILDINDAEISLRRDGELLYRAPGVAFVDGRALLFGSEAQARSRLHPRQSHSEFWRRLNADPVAPPGRAAANQADLVYLHLKAIREAAGITGRAETVVAAPSSVTGEQLAVLLGIAAEAELDVVAIVDAPVAVASAHAEGGACRVLDVSLHRAIVTSVESEAASEGVVARRGSVDEVPEAAFAVLVEGWVDVVADRFVSGSRFDPLRIAATEQQVFDQVLAGLAAEQAEFSIEVGHDSASHHVSVAREAFAQKSRQRYDLLSRAVGAPGRLAITHRARRLPGLAARLQAAGHELLLLPENAAALAIDAHAERIGGLADSTGARLVTALPLLGAAGRAQATAAAPTATHLLCAGLAVAIGTGVDAADHPASRGAAAQFRVARQGDGLALLPLDGADVQINGQRVDFEHPVGVGDVVRCGNAEYRLIRVVD